MVYPSGDFFCLLFGEADDQWRYGRVKMWGAEMMAMPSPTIVAEL